MARGWTSAAQTRGHLARSGIQVAASVYAEWESGTRLPSERQLEQLKAFYGTTPTEATETGLVAAAIRDQTAVLEALVAELRAMRGVQEGMSDGLSKVLGALLPEDARGRLLSASQTENGPQ